MCHSTYRTPYHSTQTARLRFQSSQCQGRRPFLLHRRWTLVPHNWKTWRFTLPRICTSNDIAHCCIAYRRHRTRVWGFLARLRTPRSVLLVRHAGPNSLRTCWPLKEPSFHHTPSRLRSPVMLSRYHRAAPATHDEVAAPLTFTLTLR